MLLCVSDTLGLASAARPSSLAHLGHGFIICRHLSTQNAVGFASGGGYACGHCFSLLVTWEAPGLACFSYSVVWSWCYAQPPSSSSGASNPCTHSLTVSICSCPSLFT